jgi:hypothetical protein
MKYFVQRGDVSKLLYTQLLFDKTYDGATRNHDVDIHTCDPLSNNACSRIRVEGI